MSSSDKFLLVGTKLTTLLVLSYLKVVVYPPYVTLKELLLSVNVMPVSEQEFFHVSFMLDQDDAADALSTLNRQIANINRKIILYLLFIFSPLSLFILVI